MEDEDSSEEEESEEEEEEEEEEHCTPEIEDEDRDGEMFGGWVWDRNALEKELD